MKKKLVNLNENRKRYIWLKDYLENSKEIMEQAYHENIWFVFTWKPIEYYKKFSKEIIYI